MKAILVSILIVWSVLFGLAVALEAPQKTPTAVLEGR